MFTVMRIENHLIVTRRQVNETLIKARQEIVTMTPSDDKLLAFMSSNGRISSRIPPEISPDFISDTYLCLQIEAIDEILHRLSSASNFYAAEEPWEGYLPPYHPAVHNVISYDKTALRQDVILQSLQIRSYLHNHTRNLSIQAGAWSMVNLCNGLYTLNMIQEALTTSKWTVDLFRTLAKTASQVYLPYLVHSLRILSTFYAKVGDVDASLAAISKAVEISRGLQSLFTAFDIKIQFGEALATLAFVWDLKGNKEESLKAAQEGVNIYESALLKNGGLSACVFQCAMPYKFDGIPDEVIRDYGRALNQLSFSFQGLNLLADPFRTAGEALEIFISSTHSVISDSHKVDIAFMQYRISHQDFHEFIPLEEALSLSEQAVAVYRISCIKDLEQHGLALYHASWEQANILGKLGRHDEALALWKEIAKLASDTMADQTFFADALNQVSWSLRRLQHYDEAAFMRAETVKVYSGIQTSADEVAQDYFELGVDLQIIWQIV